LDAKRKRVSEIEKLEADPSFWNDARAAGKLAKEKDFLNSIVSKYEAQSSSIGDVSAIIELANDGDDNDLVHEAEEILSHVERALDDMEFQRMLSGDNDHCDAILFINAGAGGTEACDWADILLRMYRRWADSHEYKNEILDFTPGDGAGFRGVTMSVSGKYAYGYLKAENGVHRLVRISPFDANKRRHTSFSSIFVLPDLDDDVEVDIRDDDLRIDTYRAGGAGGQHVNKTDSAVRITHIPTGIVVACQNERSQHQNKHRAMRLLRAKLYDFEMKKRREEQEKKEKGKKKIEWGSQIRSYVLQPYRMVKDHRTGIETGNVDAVLDGEIDDFIRQYLLEFES